jgi:hypothetical protein
LRPTAVRCECGRVAVHGGTSLALTAVGPSAGTGTVDVTVTTSVGTSPVDTARDSFTFGTGLALLATASASITFQNLPGWVDTPSK